jgi:hypothetical protein
MAPPPARRGSGGQKIAIGALVVVVVLVVIGTVIGGGKPAPSTSPVPSQVAVSSSTPTVAAATPAPTATPRPTVDDGAVRDAVGRLDQLQALINDGADTSAITAWALDAAKAVHAAASAPVVDARLLGWVTGVTSLLQALDNGTDPMPAANALLAERATLASAIGGVPTPEPTGPTRYSPGQTVTVTENGADWSTIVVSQVKQVMRYSGAYYSDVPKAGNIFIQAYVTYTALADGVDYNRFDWQVFVGGTAVDDLTTVLYGPTPELHSGSLPKGRKAVGWVVYEVPKTGTVLLSYGSTFSNKPPLFEVVLRR